MVDAMSNGPENVQEIHPLSTFQQAILLRQALDPAGEGLLLTTLLELESRAHLERLIDALNAVIARHDVLRSCVIWEKLPQPLLIIRKHAKLPVEQIALDTACDAQDQMRTRMATGHGGIDLRRAPLLRLQVAPDADGQRWYAALGIHHLISDHHSRDCLIREAFALLSGQRELPAAVAYRRYLEWIRSTTRDAGAEAFFKEKLAGAQALSRPYGLSDAQIRSAPIDEARERIGGAFAERLRLQASRCGVRTSRLFHAAWALVIARLSASDEILFGTDSIVSYARDPKNQPSMGLFICPLPLRLDLGALTVAQFVAYVAEELTRVLNHRDAAFLSAADTAASGHEAPAFIATLNYRYSVGHSVVDPEASAGRVPGARVIGYQDARAYPLALTIDNLGSYFALTAKVLRPIDPARVLGYVRTALESLVEALEKTPEAGVRTLQILPETERNEILKSFNATHAAYPQTKLLHELFESQAAAAPDTPAVAWQGETLSYRQLNRRANQLAHYLRERGVGPESLVALCLRRSAQQIVALLAVLKAGAAYVPLDPANPPERLRHILDDANPSLVLTSEGSGALLGEHAGIVALEDVQRVVAEQPDGNIDVHELGITSRNLAYVIYTSGSTGEPKGVAIEHRNIVNYAVYAARQFDVCGGDGSLICSSFSFDLMLTGLYPVLLSGRCVRLCGEQEGLPELERGVREARNLAPLKITPSHLSLLEPALRRGQLAGCVRTLVFGGEALHSTAAALWRRYAPETALFNHYGPTETTVGCIVHEIGSLEEGPVPIGRPIANTQAYILDASLQPVPVGVSGDLYIGGAGVARGYLGRPQRTAERFLRDPFRADSDARMYRTGDLARWRPDGVIEFLGRSDDQVKIRGFRIELGEIEAHLMRNPLVRRAAVSVREESPGEKLLVAFVAPSAEAAPVLADEASGQTALISQLREDVRMHLPDYMIPSSWALVEEFPVTSNGKVDRHALAGLPQVQLVRDSEPPSGEIEQSVAAIWAAVLHVEKVGRNENFFELGGNSLLGMKVLVQIGETLKMMPPLVSIFRAPTVREMAGLVETLLSENVPANGAADPSREQGAL